MREKFRRWLWKQKVELYFFVLELILESRLEIEARKYSKDKVAREHYKNWRRNLTRYEDLTPEQKAWWDEEERLKWEGYYNDLL